MKFQKLIPLLTIFLYVSCSNNSLRVTGLEGVNKSIKAQYAPDKRVAIFDIKFDSLDDKIIASGMTDSKEGYQKLLDSLKSLDVQFINNIRVLPDTVVGNKMFAVARNSVINIRSAPKHSAELGTQGLLGMSLKILDKEGDFYRIQTPDSYISWVDRGGIYRMNKGEFDTWNASKKVIFTKNFGYVYAKRNSNSTIVSDITLGGLLKYLSEDASFYEVKYPDNRTGFIKKSEGIVYKNWLQKLQPSKENIEIAAKKLEGFPYLWGGTSSKGIDCSGFTKMVYLMNGFIIPRDASQQINAGKTVDANLTFDGLEKGDLLFFGTKATTTKNQRVTHVGIWLGNNKMEFIHSAGNVHLSSMDSLQANYDEFNKNRYLGSKRYLGIKDKDIIDLKEKMKL
ncbi:glycoside hydrolase [Polaribacter sp. ALD11]|uniref:SH3 domain-containing C40 family peptidase n=1 Tax=Polaribacter sp. ALD11 TaxID=2058137 RepID=UPI000C311FFC|nr:SH3 domain-containing C40 family peptidase [Polaribacter sp. ALD11]AUC85115.1 glycoside hydrolase [Polaribacter sp. ALD11]